MHLKGLEISLLVEGLSDKGKTFLDVMKWILSKNPQELVSLFMARAEGIFNPSKPILEEGPSAKVTAPKGEFAEIARGSDHRAVAMRFVTPGGADKIFYFVIPLLNFDGSELTDNKARSGIQNRFKEILAGLEDGQDMGDVLQSVFTDPDSAISTLKEIDRFASIGNPAEREQMAQQAPDPLRDGAVAAVRQFLPTETKTLEELMKLRPGHLGQLFQGNWGLDQDARAELISQAAEIMDGDPTDPRTVKLIAGLALAYHTRSVLERTK